MMTGWFRRARQTRSTVTNREEAHRQQRLAACAAYRMLGAIGLIAQLMLWVTLYAYDRLVQTTWQAALLLALPLAGLWALWRGGEGALATQKGARCTLLLLPCLVLDAAVLIRTLAGYISQLIPEYPYWACALVPAVLCWLTALLSRENGAAYGASLFRLLLPGLFLLGGYALAGGPGGAIGFALGLTPAVWMDRRRKGGRLLYTVSSFAGGSSGVSENS